MRGSSANRRVLSGPPVTGGVCAAEPLGWSGPNTLNCPNGVKPSLPNSLFAALTCKLRANWTFVPSWRTCPANSGSPALPRGKETGRLVGCAPHLRFLLAVSGPRPAGPATGWHAHAWESSEKQCTASFPNSKNAILARRWDYWDPCADLGLFWCVSFRERWTSWTALGYIP